MPLPHLPGLRVLRVASIACALIACADAAPKPLPELSPEERELRVLVQPLRDGLSDGADLEPLHAWLDARTAAGQQRRAEQELRRLLKRLHTETDRDLHRSADWIHTLRVQRSRIYRDVAERRLRLARATERVNELPAVPELEEVLPERAEVSDAFIRGHTDLNIHRPENPNDTGEIADALPIEGLSSERAEGDMDMPRLLNRLTLDLTALSHLLHACDNAYEDELERHRDAMKALEAFLASRRQRGQSASS